MERTEDSFWVVVNVKFPTNVSHKHTTRMSAVEEAKRLATTCGGRFVVMESVYGVELNSLTEINYTDIPF